MLTHIHITHLQRDYIQNGTHHSGGVGGLRRFIFRAKTLKFWI